MNQLIKLSSLLIVMLLHTSVAFGQDQALWEKYKSSFISKDGRIIDYYQGQRSHSEGQSYGMFLAVAYNDRATFDNLWQWTKGNLSTRSDNLLAWGWGKRPNGEWKVIDYNNATDGDILIAYALLKATKKWADNNYREEGLKIIESIRKNLAVNWRGHTFLLPGYYGFTRGDGFVLNPSYLIPPALRYFASVDEKAFWTKVYKDSLFLIAEGSFGKLHLPADWVILNETGISIFNEKKPYFGYEAIRTFLYLSWEDNPQFPTGLNAILNIYKKLGYFPRWVDLEKNSFSLKSASAGFYAVYARVSEKRGEKELSKKLFKEAKKKLIAEKNNYFSFSLYLLAESSETINN